MLNLETRQSLKIQEDPSWKLQLANATLHDREQKITVKVAAGFVEKGLR